ncbi:MAG TPA: S8 family peptidase, partial [Roseiflexaceae bacterium]|nr:S8 family peptidase [Roseiflexaceae bacterium]
MSLRTSSLCATLILALLLTPTLASSIPAQATSVTTYIVQSNTAAAAAALATAAGGRVTQELAIIDGVAAQLDARALARLQADGRVRLHIDASVRSALDPVLPEQRAPLSYADPLHGPRSNSPNHDDDDDDDDDGDDDDDDDESDGSDSETITANHLLYPSAATGAHLLRPPYIGFVNTPNLRCQNQRVNDLGGVFPHTIQGWGVTVAVIDSGFEGLDAKQWKAYDPATRTLYTDNNEGRCLVYRDFLPVGKANGNQFHGKPNSVDQNGHGTHVASTIADARFTQLAAKALPTSVGVAPKVNLLIARALDKDGSGSYATVIAAIEWVVQNKDRYRVRVLNLSLHAPVAGPYWADPMNQAVMKAWQAGIVVVVSAGNAGPNAGTIAAPGNVPYVITVGAIKSGRYTQDGRDDLATYSSRGPTESAFVKPDVVVPASRTIAPMPDSSSLARQLQQLCGPGSSPDKPCVQTRDTADYGFGTGGSPQSYYYLSGTSMAAAEVSGLVALLLQTNPQLTNDQVKWRLLSTARPNVDQTTGKPTYSPWEQGAGLVDIRTAIHSTALDRANGGMDIAQDLVVTGSPQTHYWGSTIWDSTAGEFRLVSPTSGQPLAVWSGATRVWIDATRV